MFGMGAGFELPVVLLALVKIGLLDYAKLSAMRRYMIVGNLILGALLTTPEVFTQVCMAIALQVLFRDQRLDRLVLGVEGEKATASKLLGHRPLKFDKKKTNVWGKLSCKKFIMPNKSSVFLPMMLFHACWRAAPARSKNWVAASTIPPRCSVSAKSRRSIEQTDVFGSPDQSRTVGFIHGIDRTVERTASAFMKSSLSPFPTIRPWTTVRFHAPGRNPVYPDSYKPNAVRFQLLA